MTDPPPAPVSATALNAVPLDMDKPSRPYDAAGSGTLVRLLHGFATVASLTLLAKAVSFFKEATVARQFGVSDDLDAFVLSFTLLSFLATILGGGMPDAFLPAFARVTHEHGSRQAHRLGFQMALCNLATFSGIAAVLYFAAPALIALMSRGFDSVKQARAVAGLRGLIPFFVCFGMTYHFSAWLRAQKRFVMPALTPAFAPAFIIICILATGENASIQTLILGTNLGVVLHLTFLSLALARTLPKDATWLRDVHRRWEPSGPHVLRNTFPFLLAGLVLGSAPLVDQIMASWLEPGSVTVLGYSEKITSIVLALCAAPASEALFPFFADAVARREWREVRSQLVRVTGTILIVAIPATLVMCWLAPAIVHLLFERGAFDTEDTARVATVLRFSVFQIPFYIASILAARIAVSMQASRFMLGMACASLSVNVIFNAWFMHLFGVAGIALSTVIVHLFAAICFCTFAFVKTRRLAREEPVS